MQLTKEKEDKQQESTTPKIDQTLHYSVSPSSQNNVVPSLKYIPEQSVKGNKFLDAVKQYSKQLLRNDSSTTSLSPSSTNP